MRDAEIRLYYAIFEITDAGHVRCGKYGIHEDNHFKYDRFDSVEEAVEYMGTITREIKFAREYVIMPVAEKKYKDAFF